MSPRHVIVVHYVPFIVESVDMVLSMQGYTVHAAATFGDAKVLLSALGEGLVAVIAHADMPGEPRPGNLLRLVRKKHILMPPWSSCRPGQEVSWGHCHDGRSYCVSPLIAPLS